MLSEEPGQRYELLVQWFPNLLKLCKLLWRWEITEHHYGNYLCCSSLSPKQLCENFWWDRHDSVLYNYIRVRKCKLMLSHSLTIQGVMTRNRWYFIIWGIPYCSVKYWLQWRRGESRLKHTTVRFEVQGCTGVRSVEESGKRLFGRSRFKAPFSPLSVSLCFFSMHYYSRLWENMCGSMCELLLLLPHDGFSLCVAYIFYIHSSVLSNFQQEQEESRFPENILGYYSHGRALYSNVKRNCRSYSKMHTHILAHFCMSLCVFPASQL